MKFWAASIEDDGALLLSSSSSESSPVGIGKNGLVWKVVIGLPFVVGGMTRRREHGRAHTGHVAVLSAAREGSLVCHTSPDGVSAGDGCRHPGAYLNRSIEPRFSGGVEWSVAIARPPGLLSTEGSDVPWNE